MSWTPLPLWNALAVESAKWSLRDPETFYGGALAYAQPHSDSEKKNRDVHLLPSHGTVVRMTPNTELILDVLAQIERDPSSWDQEVWDCGTTACFAGWAIRLSPGATVGDSYYPIVAAKLLGFDLARDHDLGVAFDLFDADNTLDDLYSKCAALLGVSPEVLRDKVADRVGHDA